jgi:hypothetical protein
VCVGNGSAIEVSSIKIVSGSEPINTNRLLQVFGRIAQDQNIDRPSLIRHCLRELDVTAILSENNPIGVVEAVSMPHSTQDNSPRGEVHSGCARSVSLSSITKSVSRCNEDVNQTRIMISSIVTKPKCSDTLLNKPPFRFIHDIIVAIGKATQFDLLLIFR